MGLLQKLLQNLEEAHAHAQILFIIPEAVGSITAHNTTTQTRLIEHGEVVTITQADALYTDYNSYSLTVCGSSNGGTAWTVANLADVLSNATYVLCGEGPVGEYLGIGTDGGNAAAKTQITALSTIKGSMLGSGYEQYTGLAAGVNTIASSTIFATLDMSNANISEDWFAYENVNDNTDVVIGGVNRIQRDLSLGTDINGTEIPSTVFFYGGIYSANDLTKLGLNVFDIIVELMIHSAVVNVALEISGSVGNLVATIGNKASSAATGDPSNAKVLMAYAKQVIDILIGTIGITTWPAGVIPGDGVGIAEAIRWFVENPVVAQKHLTIAALNQDPPVQNTWYTVLDTTADVTLRFLAFRQTHTEAGVKALEMQVTIDGVTLTGTQAADNSMWYYLYLDPVSDALVSGETLCNAAYNVALPGQSIKVEVRTTDAPGTAQELDGRAQYSRLVAT